MAQHQYIKTGICIWCQRQFPEVTFHNEPHIVPESLGGTEIGFDVCDECNKYFGSASRGEPNTNLIFKEMFGAIRAFSCTPTPDTYKSLSSVYFEYRYKTNTIKIKSRFSISVITRQFKRSLYEVFLQKYHYQTEKGLDCKMDAVRNYARWNKGDLKVYYLYNNAILAPKDTLFLLMSDKVISEIDDYGFFHFWFMGHSFFLEIIPSKTRLTDFLYLQKANQLIIPAIGNERLAELTDIRELDFFMERFGQKSIDVNGKLNK